MHRLLPAMLVFFSALAGCAQDGSDGPGDAAAPTGPDPRQNETEPPLVQDAVETTLYLDTGWSLVPDVPAAGAVEQGDWVPDYLQGNVDAAAFTFRSAALVNATLVDAQPVQVTLWLESDTPQPPFPGAQSTGAGAFFGSTLGMPLAAVQLRDPVFPAGEPVRFDMRLEFGGFVPIVIPAGESFALFAGFFAMTSDLAPGRILVGGEHASSVTFTMSNLSRDPTVALGSAQEETFTGTIANPESPRPTHALAVAQDAQELRIEIRLAGGRESDLDIDLFDGARHISGSHTPATYESMYLMGPALDGLRGMDLSVRVNHFNPVDAEYEITVSQR